MERFNALSRGLQLMLVGSILLLIDSFLDWQHVEVKFGGTTLGEGGVSGWHGVGVIMGLLTVVLLAWLLVRLAAVDINLPVSDAMTGALLGFLILLFTVVKFFVDNEFRHWPAWVGLILAVVIAVGAWLAVQEAGGVEGLKTEASGMSSGMGSRSDSTTTSAPPPPAAEPPAAPPPPPPPPAPSEPTSPPPSSAPPADDLGGGEDRPA
jgi:hypothetical protein